MANYIIHGLKSFYNKLREEGVRVQHQFALQFGGDSTAIKNLQDYAPIFAEGANLPGRKILTQDAQYFGFPFKIPVNTNYTQTWSCTVKCDVNMNIRSIFENWMNVYADLAKNTGGSKGVIPKNDYVLIHLLDTDFFKNENTETIQNFTPVRTYRLEGVFPSDIGDMTQSHASNAIATFPMTFTFQYWFIEYDKNNRDIGDPLKMAKSVS